MRAEDSRAGSAESNESSEDESEPREDESVEVVVWRERNVGYDVWHSVVSAFVS